MCSTNNLDTARLIGADETIDYTKEDFTKNGQRYDLILEVAARHSISDYKRALPPEGRYVLIGGSMVVMFQIMLFGALTSRREGKAMDFLMANATKQDLEFVRGLLESGEVKPVIDRHYTLDEVPGAIAYLEEGHAKGKVVVTLKRS